MELRSENDPSLAKLQLRSELSHSLRTANAKPYMLLQDPLQSQFYRMGINEWDIAKLFDGRRTLRQVVKDAAVTLGEEKAGAAEVQRLAHWLLQNELAECVEGSLRVEQPEQNISSGSSWHEPLNKTAQLGKWNPLFLKVSLPNPAPILKYLSPMFGWLFSKYFVAVWLLVCMAGCVSVSQKWSQFSSSLGDVFATENWFYLLTVWIVLKVLHETGHAIACMRYGGHVTRCGLMFILFSPIAWVDVTSSWSFRSKWQRIAVSTAGMYVEFLIAAIAAIIWSRTEDPLVATLTRNVVLSASITTLLFNLNFLMRFDGYYILSDLFDIQNLYAAGQQYIQYWQRRYLLGMTATRPAFSVGKLALVRAYGIAALIWRVTFCLGILLVAARLFHGAGVVLAIFSGVIWFAVPLLRFMLILWKGVGNEQPNRQRFALIGGSALAFAVICMLLPWPGRTTAHGVVDFSPLRTVRADSPGFVARISVVGGQQVQAGDVLLELRNEMLRRELADIELQIESQTIARRVVHRDNEMAEYESIGKKLDSLHEQRLHLMFKVSSLTVRAPISGTVIAHDLESVLGKYVSSGTELLAVGSTGEKEVRISIQQQDIDSFRDPKNSEVRLNIQGHSITSNSARLTRLHPRATRRVLHSCLSATNGGPLAVQQNLDDDESSSDVLLVEPHFEGVVSIPSKLSTVLRAGEVCRVSVGRGHQRVYEKLWSFTRSYIDRKTGDS